MTNLIEQCDIAIRKYTLFTKTDKLLLACSGGKDSIALFHYLRERDYQFEIAHVNFRLREEADEDEKFVATLAKKHNIPFHTFQVDENDVPESNIQEWAREVRYTFFEDLMNNPEGHSISEPFRYVVTAHSLDDYVESLFMNIGKGRNLWSEPGIPIKSSFYRRPLLLCSTEQILRYIQENSFEYREDKTNISDKYERNRVRHHLIPLFREHYSDLNTGIRVFLHNNYLRSQAAEYSFLQLKSQLIRKEGERKIIDLGGSASKDVIQAFLYDFLRDFNFHPDRIEQILNAEIGRTVLSDSYELLKDRETLHLRKLKDNKEVSEEAIKITAPSEGETAEYSADTHIMSISTIKNESDESQVLWLGQEQFPLKLRKWKNGDRFQPNGMRGSKKVKKYLTDIKLDRWAKEKTYVLVDANEEIVWLIPYRLSKIVKAPHESLENKKAYFVRWTINQ